MRPRVAQMPYKELLLAYLNAYQAKDLKAIASMLADDVLLRDWNISVSGKTAALAETERNFAAAGQLEINVLMVYEAADGAAAELQILVNGTADLRVVDALSFDAQGKITAIRAYKGRPDEADSVL